MRAMTATLLAVAITTPTVAFAQSHCGDRDVVTQRLAMNYGESFQGGGLRNAQAIFEVWTAEETGTWTIIMTMPNGLACIMAAGTDWRKSLPETPAGVPG